MSKVWFRNLGFHNNPFSIKPAAFHDKVFGYDKVIDNVSYGILNNKVMIVQGEYGSGKSTILRRLINDFGGKKQVIYYSCNRIDQRLNVKSLLNGRYGWLGRLFDMKPKDMILLLDEAQELGEKDYEKLYSYYQEGYFKSIVLVGQEIDTKKISNGFASRLEEVPVDNVEADTAVKIIRKRIGNLSLLSDEIIKKIFDKSENNVRLLLRNCEEACKYAVERGRTTVDDSVLSSIFGKEEVKEKKVAKKVEKNKEEKTVEKKPAKKTVEKKPVKKTTKKEEKKVEKKVEKKAQKKVSAKAADSKSKTKGKVYNPEIYNDMVHQSAEELLNKGTDEIFTDDKYY